MRNEHTTFITITAQKKEYNKKKNHLFAGVLFAHAFCSTKPRIILCFPTWNLRTRQLIISIGRALHISRYYKLGASYPYNKW